MRKLPVAGAGAAAGSGVAAWRWWHPVEHWIAHGTGSYNTAGTAHNYNFTSGFGSIVLPPFITLAGVAVLWAWHHQCHVRRCYWPARRLTAAGERACWRHHPEQPPTAETLRQRHHLYLGSRPGRG